MLGFNIILLFLHIIYTYCFACILLISFHSFEKNALRTIEKRNDPIHGLKLEIQSKTRACSEKYLTMTFIDGESKALLLLRLLAFQR